MSEGMDLALRSEALARVEDIAEKMGKAEGLLEAGYASFAIELRKVQVGKYWEGLYDSWGAYIEFLTHKFHIGRAQLYHKVAVVRELDGVVGAPELTSMGISKASVLADVHKAGEKLPDEAIGAAMDENITVKDLKRIIAEATHAAPPEATGWYDMRFAFYISDEEKKTLQEAEKLALSIDPPVSATIKDFMQRKEVAMRWAQEFLATYSKGEDDAGF